MRIKEMYDTPKYPRHYMLELLDGSTKLVYMTPFRQITEKDFWPCIATPKQVGGKPVEPYILQLYGLETVRENETGGHKMIMKGCQTVEQYKIMRWVDENFVLGNTDLYFTGRNEAILTDRTGAKAKLVYDCENQKISLEEAK